MDELQGRYTELIDVVNYWTPQIGIDVSRTLPSSFDSAKEQRLFRIMNAYATHNPDVGYCQGMTYVAGLLLEVSDNEEESFTTFARLMDRPDGLSGLYRGKFPLLHRYIHACEQMIREIVPDLHDHFIKQDVRPAMYLTQWFLTGFINCFPLSMVKIMWDTIICDGLSVILKIAVSLLLVLKDSLLRMNCEEILTYIKMMKTCDESDINVCGIGQLLIQHAETLVIPEHILGYISAEFEGDDVNVDFASPWVWKAASRPVRWGSLSSHFTTGMKRLSAKVGSGSESLLKRSTWNAFL